MHMTRSGTRFCARLTALLALPVVFLVAGISPAYARTETVRIGFFISDKYGDYVLRRCDQALYEAKSVRNTYRLYVDD